MTQQRGGEAPETGMKILPDTLEVSGRVHSAVYFHLPEEPAGFLSNWYPSPFELEGLQFSGAEQYIMYRKCMTFGDTATAEKVMGTDDPAEQQRLAKGAAGYDDRIWNGLRQPVALRALEAKFTQNPALRSALLDTGGAFLVECARSDRIWACGLSLYDGARKKIENWKGESLLGFALMEVRRMLDGQKEKSTIRIVEGDITRLDCDCIVNAANSSLLGGGGVDGAIHAAAGRELLEECRTLNGCRTGQAKITKGYRLPARWVIHTVGPVYQGREKDAQLLADCYRNSLDLARSRGIRSIAFPGISTGVYGYPLKDATEIAVSTVKTWLEENGDYPMEVIFCCYGRRAFQVCRSVAEDMGIQAES